MHYSHMFDDNNHTYYSTWAIDEKGENHHVFWAINNADNTEEIIIVEDFFTRTLFSYIDFDDTHLVVLALNRVIDPLTSVVRIHYKNKVEEVDCVNGYIIKNYVSKRPKAKWNRNIHKGNILDDAGYNVKGYDFLIKGSWEKGVGKLPVTEKQILRLMLQNTGLKEFNFYSEEDFPVRSYSNLDFKEYVQQIYIEVMDSIGRELAIDFTKQFIIEIEGVKNSISEISQMDEYQDKIEYILFSMFDHFWNEEVSQKLYEFSKQKQSYFQTIKNAVSFLRSYDLVENDLKRFGLTKTKY